MTEPLETHQDAVRITEYKHVIEALEQLKEAVKRDRIGGELKVTVDPNRNTGGTKIIFIGYTMKRDLTKLREVYRAEDSKGRTFGG